jgi:4'-phosphopantetheinyl transferase
MQRGPDSGIQLGGTSMSVEAEVWRKAPVELTHPSDRVDVWKVWLDSAELSSEALPGILAPDEVERARRFHFDRDRIRFIACRTALRTILARYLQMSPIEIRFRYESKGKPEIADAQNSYSLRFNLSHSSGLAVIAVSSGSAVGVDIERFDRKIDCLEIARRFFSMRERQALLAIPASGRQRAFFACWTRKEAFLKATGEGISFGLAEFSVSVAPDVPPLIEEAQADPKAVLRWSLTNLRPGDGYVGTLAFEAAPCVVERWCWNGAAPHS